MKSMYSNWTGNYLVKSPSELFKNQPTVVRTAYSRHQRCLQKLPTWVSSCWAWTSNTSIPVLYEVASSVHECSWSSSVFIRFSLDFCNFRGLGLASRGLLFRFALVSLTLIQKDWHSACVIRFFQLCAIVSVSSMWIFDDAVQLMFPY